MKHSPSSIRFVFFGTPAFSVRVLDQLAGADFMPSLVVTAPDKPQGRGMHTIPSPVKTWATDHGINIVQPEKIDADVIRSLSEDVWDVFIVAAYGFILPKALLEIPKRGVLNVHPSLLPKWRGSSPIQSSILHDEATGVSIMLLDEKMDHGPILAQEAVETPLWPPRARELEHILADRGGALLASVVVPWTTGEIREVEQDHAAATFSQKLKKEDGLINLAADSEKNFRKIQAYDIWPGTYFFVEKKGEKIRVKIIEAVLEKDALEILRVLPEGKREMSYEDFRRNAQSSP